MQHQKCKFKQVENLCWTIIEFVYSSVAAVCVVYSPMNDTAGNQFTLIEFRDGAEELAIVSSASVFLSAVILLIGYEMRGISISFCPFAFISIFTVYFMLLIPLVRRLWDHEIFTPILVAAFGVVIVKLNRKRFGRPLELDQ